MMYRQAVLLTFLSALTLSHLRFCVGQQEEIDRFIEHVMECGNSPGLVLTVLRDGQDYMAKGYGVRDLDSQEPVTNQTLTLINSITKAFAATTAATLVKNNSNSLDWDTPIRDVLGDWFYMNDSLRTSHVTMRDLFAHRVGIAGYSYYNFAGVTEENEDEAMRRLQYLPFYHDFRDRFHYNNLMYQLAGYVIKSVDGKRWEDVAREKILTPLSMDDTTFIWDETRWGDMMTGYHNSDENLREVSQEAAKTLQAASFTTAGGIVSNALDMRHWMHFQLDEGRAPSGEEILTPQEFQVTHEPTMHLEASPLYSRPEYPVTYSGFASGSYALGWSEGIYRDYLTSQHAGAGSGYTSLLTIVPSMELAVFTGINAMYRSDSHDFIHMYIMDQLLGYEPWLENRSCAELPTTRFHEPDDMDLEVLEEFVSQDLESFTDTGVEQFDYENIVGVYGHYALGNVTVYKNDSSDELHAACGAPGILFNLEQIGNSTAFNARGQEPFWYVIFPTSFELDDDGLARSFTLYTSRIPSIFHKDLDWSNPPPPPDICAA